MKKNLLTFLISVAMSFIGIALADENLPAGSGSTSDYSVQAFSHPLKGVRGGDRRDFTVGNSFFQGVWVIAPASTDIRDGLGPHYNATSCAACHFKDGRGKGMPDSEGPVDISLLFRLRTKLSDGTTKDHEAYGHQFSPQAIPGVTPEGESHVSFQKIEGSYADGETYELRKPQYHFLKLHYGPLGKETIVSPRVAPQMIGLGLIENIKEEDILKNEQRDLNFDGISGRANRVFSVLQQKEVLGRFGWKASQSSLIEQNAAAFLGDIGITSDLFPDEDCTYVQLDCHAFKTPSDLSMDLLKKVTIYTQLLAVPVKRFIPDEVNSNGKRVFNEVGCISCHRAHYKTGDTSDLDVLNNQDIYPYSDFLLHDMGDELSDDLENYQTEENSTAREFRTPPLWGIGLIKTVNGHSNLLHDGRARNVEEAILWHSGEAQKTKERFLKLTKKDRQELIEFINSL